MAEPRSPPRLIRWLYIGLGAVALGLGLVGVFVPLLPTTPFLLLAAWAFALGSPPLHKWLIEHRRFGPYIVAWRDQRAVPRRAKILGIAFMWTGASAALAWQLDRDWARALVVGTAVVVTSVLLAFPTARRAGDVTRGGAASSHG